MTDNKQNNEYQPVKLTFVLDKKEYLTLKLAIGSMYIFSALNSHLKANNCVLNCQYSQFTHKNHQ